MSKLFAAVDAKGDIRFAGEVPRGSACGCFCPVCASPLVSKQGEHLQWHFAHVAGQESPDCHVGAVNLVHRIGVALLREKGVLTLPDYSEVVRVRHLQDVATWKAKIVSQSLIWRGSPRQSSPVATGDLDTGAKVSLYVVVSEERPVFAPALGEEDAQVVVWYPMPSGVDLARLQSVREHILRSARVEWRHHPDVFGHVTNMRRRLQDLVRGEDRRRSRAAGMRWASIANRMKGSAPLPVAEQPGDRTHSKHAQTPPAEGRQHDDEPQYAWAPYRQPLSSFIFYRLRDGVGWVLYPRVDGTLWLVPWPMFEEWDEYLPPAVAQAIPHERMCKAAGLMQVLTFMSARSKVTRTSSNPGDFQGL